jgi:transcriptional repressor NrdR
VKCPFCSHSETKVIETRETAEEITRRRRECLKCEKRFTTYEKQESASIRVIKKDGNREMFDREKIKRGITKACEKRPISSEQIDKMVDEIERKLREKHMPEVKSTVIGEQVMSKLKKVDTVAYIRFASVYKEFEAIEDFTNVLKGLSKK